MKRKVLGASIGNCVHVAGVYHFLQLAEKEGYEVIFMGPAVSVDRLFDEINKSRPDLIGISYRLTPENVIPLLDEIKKRAAKLDYKPQWSFGGTKPVADIAKRYDMFSFISDGYDEISDSIRYLRGEKIEESEHAYGANLVDRINKNSPYPLLRHHFGLPTIEKTRQGIQEIAKAKILDVISLGTDQNAQQFMFNQKKMKNEYDGAGGVPIRSREDLLALKEASKCGNFPLMRCYSGTEDVIKYAQLLVDTINNAWTAIPLFWYNEIDGRGTRPIETSVKEALELIKWHADRNVPVECNEPHHWSLRDAHDVIPVAAAYIAAYNAKKAGVKHYISQYMFNIPHGISFSMDLARVLAMCEMVESLEDSSFKTYRETRAGLPLFHADECIAKGQLAASTFMQMTLKPQIIHVVGFCEADHAANAAEVIESCKIVKGVIRHTLEDDFSLEKDERILARKEHLINEAKYLLAFIVSKYPSSKDPLSDPYVLADIVKRGYLDAVHIVKGAKFQGNLVTAFRNGACEAINKATGKVLSEEERLSRLEKGQ